MKRYRALAVAALCLVLGAVTVLYATKTKGDRAIGSFAVKIDLPDKHGSGAHIGRGYILTAAHVVEGITDAKVITDTGAEYPAVVLLGEQGL
jgi:Trypsin-like serine proteases, typically periplasmic, contain C-terminal PDZ domain